MKTKYIYLIIAVLVIFSGLYIYYLSTFRVIKTNFPKNKLPTYEKEIDIYFSSKLSNSQSITIDITNADGLQAVGYDVSDNHLAINLNRVVEKNEELTIQINNITSAEQKVKSLRYYLVGSFIPESKISKEDKARLLEESQNKQDSITGALPFIGNNYEINYAYTKNDEKLVIIITSYAIPEEFVDGASYLNRIRSDRKEALATITSKGFDVNKYNIFYREDLLLEEFGAKSIKSIQL